MAKRSSDAMYRPLLFKGLVTAWRHKELWPFAIFAGLAGSGVVVNDLLHQAHIALSPNSSILSFLGGDIGAFIQRYASVLLSSGTENILLTILGALLVLGGGAFLVVLCQQLLLVALHRATRRKKKLTGRELLQTLKHHHYLRIFGVDLLFHVLIFIILGGGGVLLRNIPAEIFASNALGVGIAALTLFFAFILNILAMLTLIAVGEERTTIVTGLLEGVDRFLRHPIVTSEIALLIFATNLALTVGYIFGLALLGIPVGLLFAEALASNSFPAMLTVGALGSLLAAIYTILATGFMTTFTYSVWVLLAEKLNTAPFGSRFHHHVRKHFTR